MELKKNAVDLTDLAIGIIVLGIVVTIGATILLNVRDTNLTSSSIVAVTNETISGSNTTAQSLSTGWVSGLTSVVNATDAATVPANNYTFAIDSFGTGSIILTGAEFNGENINVTYNTYDTANNPAYTVANEAASGIAEYGNWFDIIVIVGVAAVILSLIFMAFGRAGSGTSGDTVY